jgi:hypothetical protein
MCPRERFPVRFVSSKGIPLVSAGERHALALRIIAWMLFLSGMNKDMRCVPVHITALKGGAERVTKREKGSARYALLRLYLRAKECPQISHGKRLSCSAAVRPASTLKHDAKPSTFRAEGVSSDLSRETLEPFGCANEEHE